MIHLIKSLGFICLLLLSFALFCCFFFFKSILLLAHRAYLCKKNMHTLSGETQPRTKVHGLMRGAQLDISS